KWATHSGTANELGVTSGQIQVTSANGEDVNASLDGGPYDSSSATNYFYASFTVKFTALPNTAGTYLAHFKSTAATAFAGRIWALTGGAAAGKFRLGISSASGSAANATYPLDLSLETNYLVVARFVNTDSAMRLWINPVAETDSSVTTTETPSPFTVAAFAFREASGEGTMSIDNLRVGTTFGDVVPDAPNLTPPAILDTPQNQSAIEGGTANFSVTATGDPAPAYQWQFNGTDLPGATNATLSLTNVDFSQSGFYTVTASNVLDVATSEPVVLNVFSALAPAFSLMDYNLHGNGVLNWTTNSSHVKAIGRQVQYLDPDIMTFQEIPVTNNGTAEMANFVAAFRPGFYFATNSTDDLYIRSVIVSRYPIVASRSWLHGSDLTPFGFSGSGFTRDLFEAEIAIPGFPQHLHVFTAHLKSSQDANSAMKRAAEASAISNFFATAFLTTNGLRPYIVTGDLNEDLMHPAATSQQAIQRLVSAPTGLRLATPFNTVSRSELTFSIQNASGLSLRYDYVLPCGLLSSNVVSSEIFRTDLLNPLPSGLYSSDDKTASDHLPVKMVFGNPYAKPFRVSFSATNQSLSWASVPGQSYRVEKSSDLITWTVLLDNLLATNSNLLLTNAVSGTQQFFRVRRLP
ncbi:MAG TPA: immunoglobulin domain-containing protein, partial [Candidatus Paceibacterota bacterium]|nr:immunoglobulin domain-containing protein [Candidatus Paceibacterota bacterium]